MVEAGKLIGAGCASVALAGAGAGIGSVFGALGIDNFEYSIGCQRC